MPYYKFGQNDIFRNQIETHPQCDFHFHNGVAYFNQTQPQLGEMDPTPMVQVPSDDQYWDKVELLLPMDTEVSGIPPDLSDSGHTVDNVNSNWDIDTTEKPFGTASGDFTTPRGNGGPNTTASILQVQSDDFKMGTEDFTIEGWFYYPASTSSSYSGIFHISADNYFNASTYPTAGLIDSHSSIALGISGYGNLGHLNLIVNGTGSRTDVYSAGFNVQTGGYLWSQDTWVHFAVVRASSVTRVYIDGVAAEWSYVGSNAASPPPPAWTGTDNTDIPDSTDYEGDYLGIGKYTTNTNYEFVGNIAHFRVTKGAARYTGVSVTTPNFTLPTAAFPGPDVLAPSTSHIPQNVTHVPSGYLSLYELNIDRKLSAHDYNAKFETGDETMIYPFVVKNGSSTSFKTVSTSILKSSSYGAIMTGSYPMSASVTTEHYYTSGSSVEFASCDSDTRRHIRSLKNTLNSYLYLSREYSYENYDTEETRLVNIPSIFYGSHVEKGTVELKLFYKGELVAKLSDPKKNGELIQTYPETVEHCGTDPHPDYGNVAGVILYTEGAILLTGKWDMDLDAGNYVSNPGGYWLTCPDCVTANPSVLPPRWIYFASLGDEIDWTCNSDPAAAEAAGDLSVTLNPDYMWSLSFNGTNFVPVLTMLTHAPIGELNHSNNPTFTEHGQDQSPDTGRTKYIEKDKLTINNTVKSPYNDPNGNFRKQTWISKIGIYDEDKNLVGIAKLATPIRKTEEREFTFKLKLDF